MARKPQPGGDRNAWGLVLNELLDVAHNPDGTIKPAGVQTAVATEVETALSVQLPPAVIDALADDPTVAAAAADAIDAEPRVAANTSAIARVDPGVAGTDGYAIIQTPTGPKWAPPQARISAYALGVRADTGTAQNAALHAAFTAAEALGGGRTIELPAGTVTIDGTFSLSGYSSGMVGTGGTSTGTAYTSGDGTVLKCINQTGAVLDFNGYLPPVAQKGRPLFADFSVEGDGTAGTAKKGIYLYTGAYASSVDFHRISVWNTGGTPLHIKDFYLSEFHAITLFTPVNVVANDVPYALLEGANGNRYYGLGIRSSNHDALVADVGVSGAIRCTMGSSFQNHRAVFYGTWLENLHLPSNAAMIVTQTNAVTWSDTQFFDCFKLVGATNTATVRMESPASQNNGGNVWRGIVEGKGSGTNIIDTGIVLAQSGNMVEGPKGWGGNNVVLESGVQYCHVELTGAEVAGNNFGIVDNSGNTTNTLIDGPMGIWKLGSRAGTERISLAGVDQSNAFTDLGTPTGNITLNMNFGSNIFKFILNANRAISAVSYTAAKAGRFLTVIIKQDATGNRTVTWPASFGFTGGPAPTLSTGANRTDVFTFIFDGTSWRETSRSIGQ